MAFNVAIRRSSSSSLSPLVARLLGGQRTFNHHCGGALVNAVNHTRKIISNSSSLVPAVSRYLFSTSPALTRPSTDESLLRIIDSEIKCSEESFEEDEDTPEGFSFKINDIPGQQTISLTREYEGQHIRVDVEPSDLVTGEDDDSDSDADKRNETSLPMVVKISKPGANTLEFGITAYTDEIVIDNLSVKDPNMAEDQLPYEGPRFDELDESMQKAFHGYLETRGITAAATEFLHDYMVNKEHREYTNWLKNLKEFIDA